MCRLVDSRRQGGERRRPYGSLIHNPFTLKVSVSLMHRIVFAGTLVELLVGIKIFHVHYRVLLVGVVLLIGGVLVLGARRRRGVVERRGARPGRPRVRQKGRDAEADVAIFAAGQLLLLRTVGFLPRLLHSFSVFGVQAVGALDSHNLSTLCLFPQHQDFTTEHRTLSSHTSPRANTAIRPEAGGYRPAAPTT